MRKIDAKIMAETQKIRHYIMNLLYRSAGRQTMIPSSRELAVQFGVSRTTVRVVLEKLTAEEYLVVKRGIGTFTNPFALQPGCFGKEALIGLKSGHGDSFFYAPPEARAVAFMLETAAECGFNSRLLSAGCDDEREAKVELINSHVDGVLCYNTQPWFTRSAAALLPTVLLYNREAGVPCVMLSALLHHSNGVFCPVLHIDFVLMPVKSGFLSAGVVAGIGLLGCNLSSSHSVFFP